MAEWIFDFFNNASFESPVNEASKEEETKFHKKLDTLVHNTFGKRKGELEERIHETLNKINEELCPAGKAYIKKRKAAGEKSSAYLSGRAVKVCKGQMSGKAKKK
jgi:hypothetical protein